MEAAHTITRLAGFAFGHAAWSICETDEVLGPMTFVKSAQGNCLTLLVGEANNAVTQARAELEQRQDIDCYALAYEGIIRYQGARADAIIIEAGAPGTPSITFAHRFTKEFTRGPLGMGPRKVKSFRLPGNLQVFGPESTTDAEAIADEFYEGVSEHPKAGLLAQSWFAD